MGRLIKGQWCVEPVNPDNEDGEYQRQEQAFRQTQIEADPERYHLYVSLACPWAHRVLIMRSLKGLEEILPVSVVSPWMLEQGWSFAQDHPGTTGDSLYQLTHLKDLYIKADPQFSGRVTVPVLWDKKNQTIINNESAELVRILNDQFNEFAQNPVDYSPLSLREEIDKINELTYEAINNGVYKTGFARKQEVYENHLQVLFERLNYFEDYLKKRDFLVGDRLTEADIRLFTTLVRFDCVYFGHFKCNLKQLREFPELHRYTRNLLAIPEIKKTVDFGHIKTHYYGSHETLNPSRIIPAGPEPLV